METTIFYGATRAATVYKYIVRNNTIYWKTRLFQWKWDSVSLDEVTAIRVGNQYFDAKM